MSVLKIIALLSSLMVCACTGQAPIQDQSESKLIVDSFPKRDFSIFFDSGRSTPSPKQYEQVDAAVRQFHTLAFKFIQLHGHADFPGTWQSNYALSLQRAQAVQTLLVARGIPKEAIDIKAHGSRQPMILDKWPGSEPQNRRVDIRLYWQ